MKRNNTIRHSNKKHLPRVLLFLILIIIHISIIIGQTTDHRKLELVVKTGHTDKINSIKISPNGKFLAVLSGKTIKIWNLILREEIKTIELPKYLFSRASFRKIEFSKDGRQIISLISGLDEDEIIVWNIETLSKKILEIDGQIQSFSLSDDNKNLITQSCKLKESVESKCEIKIYDIINEKVLKSIFTYDAVYTPEFPIIFNEKELIFSTGSEIKFFDPITFSQIKTLNFRFLSNANIDLVNSLVVSESNIDATGKYQKKETGYLSKLYTGEIIKKLEGEFDNISGLKFSSDGNFIGGVVFSNYDSSGKYVNSDYKVIVWETKSGNQILSLRDKKTFEFNPNNNEVIVSTSKIDLPIEHRIESWNINSGKREYSIDVTGKNNPAIGVAISPNGERIAFGSINGVIQILNLETGDWESIDVGFPTLILFFSPDNKKISTVHSLDKYKLESSKSGLKTWNILDHKLIENILPSTQEEEKKLKTRVLENILPQNAVSEDEKIKSFLGASNEKIFITMIDLGKYKITNKLSNTEIADLYLLDEKKWIVVSSDGRFDASESALKLMHYSYGLEIINLEQLKEAYFEPDLLQKLMGFSDEPLRPIVPLNDVKLYPEIIEQKFDEKSGKLTVKLKSRGGGVGETQVFVKGTVTDKLGNWTTAEKLVVADARDKKLKAAPNVPDGEIVTLEVNLPPESFIKGSENQIRVVTSNYLKEIGKGNIQSRGVETFYLDKSEQELKLPTLYAVIGGVSDYTGDQLDLRFAAKDAEDFSNALALGGKRLFGAEKVDIRTFSTAREKPEEQPTKENFKSAIAEIATKAKPEDIVVIYLAGHGVTLGTGTDTYFYLTKEARSALKSDLAANFQTVAISNAELVDWLTPDQDNPDDIYIKALKQVIILDTCSAGNFAREDWKKDRDGLTGDQIRAMEFLKDKTGTFVMMGSAANAVSYEANNYNQGLLTYALLQGMKGFALQKNTENVDVRLLFDYAEKRVPELARSMNLEQRPVIKQPTGNTFVIGQITGTDKDRIVLPEEKPIVLRPQLGVMPRNNDPLDLTASLAKALDAESSYEVVRQRDGKEPILVYLDDKSFPNAIQISGTYKTEGDLVKVKLYFFKGDTEIAELDEIKETKTEIINKLLSVIRTELSKLD